MISTLVESANKGDADAAAKIAAIRKILSDADVDAADQQSLSMFYNIWGATGAPDMGQIEE